MGGLSVMSSMRIVLVDPLGDVLFSGESLIARGPEDLPETLSAPPPPPPPIAAYVAAISSVPSSEAVTQPERAHDGDVAEDAELESHPCPETMRSAGSGVFRAVDPSAPASRLRNAG
jgi:hypothetical protein